MKLRILLCCIFICPLAFAANQGKTAAAPAASASAIPHLRKHGTATQLVIDGKPFLALAGELHNNSATSVEYMKPLWSKIAASKLNTVLTGVSWAQIEPQEGKFDFTVLDGAIQGARSQNLRLVLLWFATWKNGLSSYPPNWVKKDSDRFPRAEIFGDDTPWPVFGGPRFRVNGNLSIELFSPLGDATRDADAKAFAAMMRHIKAVDVAHTVIGIQVENETGIQGDTRDRSPAAIKAFNGPVPQELMSYLQAHKDTLIPELHKVWEATGFKTSGTWTEVFGSGRPADEIFMAWVFSRYIGKVVEAGKAEYPIPMITNCPQEGFGRAPAPLKGGGQSGGAMADAFDIWRAGAPKVDMFGADIYSNDYAGFCARYSQGGNPLFIAETGGGSVDVKAKAIYAFGRHDACAFSPFGIDSMVGNPADPFGYDLLSQLSPLILEHQGNGTMTAILPGATDAPTKIQLGNYLLEVAATRPRGGPPAPAPGQAQAPAAGRGQAQGQAQAPAAGRGQAQGQAQAPAAGRGQAQGQAQTPAPVAMFISTGPDEFYAIGRGVTVYFYPAPNTPGLPLAGLGTVEEGSFVNGRWVPGRWLAGDDTEQGQYLDFRNLEILHFNLYRYK
jgi:hypothetical protein